MRISDWSSDVCSSDLWRLWRSFSGLLTPITIRMRQRGSPAPVVHHLRPSSTSASPSLRMLSAILVASEEATRSEEHTSELQSLMRISYAVFCLKKKIYNNSIKHALTVRTMEQEAHTLIR